MTTDEYLSYAVGEPIFRFGEPGDCAYLIEQGQVAISLDEGAGVQQIARRGAGEIIGEMAIIDSGTRSAHATALTPTRLRRITRESLTRRMDGADPVMRLLMDLLLVRLRQTMQAMDPASTPADDYAPQVSPAEASAMKELLLEQDLARAIAQDELMLHYQPIVHLKTMEIAGFEALVRWQHPSHGWLPPLDFVPLAERSGLIRALTRWCLARAARDVQGFSSLLPMNVAPHVAVNVSGHDLVDSEFNAYLEQILASNPAAESLLKIEVTESVFAENPEIARACLQRCRELGVGVAIDDFGTGYSSLSQLHSLPITALKIDRSFVMRLGSDATSRKIVQTILRLASDLDIQTVAEGIEDEAAMSDLATMGVTFGQGYHFSRPLPFEAAVAWLQAHNPKAETS
ncbi:MAG: EAL domain-containing protein [Pararhodobacter sp.]